MTTRRCLLLLLVVCVVGLCVPVAVGMTYAARISTHAGFHLVRVTDALGPVADLRRPRRAVMIVLDGLGHEEAQTMRSLSRLQERGQCRKTDVGPLSLSRPVYAVLSTGLEQDRTGARGNDDTVPLAAESVWEVARASGLTVSAVSELPWWRELFPRGFDHYVMGEQSEDYFTMVPPADVQLIHPLYIDEAGHDFGAAAPEYAAAVARADREIEDFLATLDLERDLVIVTADHGHSLRGGHGGRQDRIAYVRTCFAGRGVRHLDTPAGMQATVIAPALALLLGLRFPATMRAGDDDLDALWDIADPAAFPPGYLDGRRATLADFRQQNREHLLRWLPDSEGSWIRFVAWHRWLQVRAALPFAALLLLVLAIQARAHRGRRRDGWFGLGFVGLACLALFGLQVSLRSSFDLSSIAHREDFIGFTAALGVAWTAATIGLHLRLRRDLRALAIDMSALSIAGTLLSLAHPAALGWYLGFPLPAPALYFWPYFAAIVLGIYNGAGLLLGLFCAVAKYPRVAAPTP